MPWYVAGLLTIVLLISIGVGWWRSNSTGAQIQVPMFYDAHYLFPRAWTQEQAAPGVPDPSPIAFYGQNRISQTFTSGSDRLSMVEVWLQGKGGEIVFVSLFDDHGIGVGGNIELREGQKGGYYRLAFEPFDESNGKQFTMTMNAPEATVEDPVITRTVGGDWLNGALLINEYNRPGNLELRTYASGLPGKWWLEAVGEQLLPSTFLLRLQQYKPEFYKGPFLLSLAVTTIVLSILFLVLASPGLQSGVVQISALVGWTVVFVLSIFMLWQVFDERMIVRPVAKSIQLEATNEFIARAPNPGSPPRLVSDLVADLWTAERYPEERFVNSGLIAGYPGIHVPADSRLEYNMNVPPNTWLRVGVVGEGEGELTADVLVGDQSVRRESLLSVSNPGEDDITWLEVSLDAWAGKAITLILDTAGDTSETTGWWIMPQLESATDWVLADPVPFRGGYQVTEYRFNDSVELMGYEVAPEPIRTGETLQVKLYWRPLIEIETYGKVFVHLLDAEGNLVAQDDGQPVNEAYPIPLWQTGTIIVDTHTLQLPPDVTEGEYRIAIGLYDPDSLQRWAVEDQAGQNVSDGRIVLPATIEVAP